MIYRLGRLRMISPSTKLRLFLDLEWVFDRLCHENSFEHFSPTDHPVRAHSGRSVLEFLHRDQVVLDLGCGTGDLSVLIAAGALRVTGVDHDARAIALARARHQRDNLEFVCAEALTFLRTHSGRFDVLVLSHILEHLDDPGVFLRQFSAGFSSVYVELPDFDRTYLNSYRLALGCGLLYTDDDHVWEFDRHELAALLKSGGLEIVRAEYRYGVQKVWCRVSAPPL